MTQAEALNLLKLGYNTFLTGAAGSGKTYLLNSYIDHLRDYGVGVSVTASTGIAATHLGGSTLHSFAGLGVREGLTDEEVEEIAGKERIRRNFSRTDVLIIDEVSMLHPYQLDAVDRIARRVKLSEKPFGGLQVILCGDFFQLPPVSVGRGREKSFAYECHAWEEGGFQVCYLEEQFRQSGDALLEVLNMIRSGEAGEEAKVHLRPRYKKDPEVGGRATKLYVRNVNVDAINESELAKLSGAEKVFHVETKGFGKLVETLKRNSSVPESLPLKVGAEVMFIKNSLLGKYVNGTRGVVESFDEDNGFPVVRTLGGDVITASPEEWRLEENGAVKASLTQVPLRLAWAVTIHKSQGMTLDAAEIDLSDAFEPGMGYVALSRLRSLSGLKLMGLNETALSVHPKILIDDKKFREWSGSARKALSAMGEENLSKKHDEVLVLRFGGKKSKAGSKKLARGKKVREATHEVTRRLIAGGMTVSETADERGLSLGTIISHLEKLKGLGTLPDIEHLKPKGKDFENIKAVFVEFDDGKLSPVFEKFDGKHSFETLRVVRLFL